jgi:peptidoglycan L-alanyl-D-glutamate endopeptidase CwlK
MTLKQIQEALNRHGYGPLVVDGKSGVKTTAAIKQFQKVQGLVPDGIVGADTLARLEQVEAVCLPATTPPEQIDALSLQRIEKLHPSIRDEVKNLVNKANQVLTGITEVRIVQGYRTFAEQQALYNQGRTTPGKVVTKAKAGQSIHNYGLAIDFCLLVNDVEISWDTKKDWDGDKVADWMEVVKIFRDAGYTWGGLWQFTDLPHLEKPQGHTWKTLAAKHNAKDFIPGTTYVKL